MKRRALYAVTVALLLAGASAGQVVETNSPGGDTEVYFSPRGGVMDRIIGEIDHAQKSVHVEAYSFTSLKIEAALVAAHKRGVEVQVVVDKSWPSQAARVVPLLVAAGVPVAVDSKHAIAHAKTIIIDGERVLSGSYNFTAQAELYNHEIWFRIRNRTIAAACERDFAQHQAHSSPP